MSLPRALNGRARGTAPSARMLCVVASVLNSVPPADARKTLRALGTGVLTVSAPSRGTIILWTSQPAAAVLHAIASVWELESASVTRGAAEEAHVFGPDPLDPEAPDPADRRAGSAAGSVAAANFEA